MNSIYYIANIRIPTEKAHGIQIMKMCESFSKQGQNVSLIVPRRFNFIKKDPFEYYALSNKFNIKRIPVIDTVNFGKIGFIFESLQFSIFSTIYVLFSREKKLFTRDTLTAFILLFLGKQVIFEIHTGGYNFMMKFILKKIKTLVVISNGLKNFYIEKGVEPSKIRVCPDSVDIEMFTPKKTKDFLREELGFPVNDKIIVYTGHLYDWKGADLLAEAAKNIDATTVFVGGTDKEVESFKKKYQSEKIVFVGRVGYGDISKYTKMADVLVIPNSAKSKVSREFTSPMKLFEYMASKNVIVSSDIPSIREILSDNDAIFFKSDNIKSLRESISRALTEDSTDRINNSYNKVLRYSWEERAKNIINYYAN